MDYRNTRGMAISIALAMALAACAATTPVASPPPAAPAVQATAATAAPADRNLDPPGFRRVVRNGEELFCQTRTSTGSRARTAEVCMSRDEIRRMEEVNEQYRRDAQSAGSQSTLHMDSPR